MYKCILLATNLYVKLGLIAHCSYSETGYRLASSNKKSDRLDRDVYMLLDR